MPEKKKTKQQQIVEKSILKQEAVEAKIEANAAKINKNVDLAELMKDPEGYIVNLAKQFYLAHKKEMLEAIKIGEEGAKKLIEEINGKKDNTNKEGDIPAKQKS